MDLLISELTKNRDLTEAKEAGFNESKTETAGALNDVCGLRLMFSCTVESLTTCS